VRRLAGALVLRAAWLVVIPLLRLRARLRVRSLVPGAVTVVTVNWNAAPYLEVLLRLVRKRSPDDVRIIVVDNGSRDGSKALLARRPDVQTIALPFNLGHDLALDIGFLSVRTEYAVALDIDAFPLHERWLDELLAPLSSGSTVSGARLNSSYVHPCCLALRTARFVERGLSFRSHYRPREDGRDASGDLGEDLSIREAPRLHFFEPTSQRGPGDVGTVFGDLVYHNFYSTRFLGTDESVLDQVVRTTDAEAAWAEALARYDD